MGNAKLDTLKNAIYDLQPFKLNEKVYIVRRISYNGNKYNWEVSLKPETITGINIFLDEKNSLQFTYNTEFDWEIEKHNVFKTQEEAVKSCFNRRLANDH